VVQPEDGSEACDLARNVGGGHGGDQGGGGAQRTELAFRIAQFAAPAGCLLLPALARVRDRVRSLPKGPRQEPGSALVISTKSAQATMSTPQ
jgi:hypothetical protein